jgi:sulfur relay (sulfurtransferase) DsrC/TusE family protein
MINFTFYFEISATHIRSYNTSGCLDIAFIDTNKKIVKSKIKRNIVKTDNIKLKKNNNNYIKLIYYVPNFFCKFENILPGMRRKVNISTLMVFRNQRRRRRSNFFKGLFRLNPLRTGQYLINIS